MRTRRFTLALVAILAALAALAACGGEDGGLGNRSLGDESTNDDQGSNDESSNDDESSDDTFPEDTDESLDDTSPDDTGAADDQGESSGDGGEFCDLYNEFNDGAFAVTDGTASPDELREIYERFDEIAGPLVDSAPAEISDDVETLVDTGAAIGDVLEDHDYDIESAMSDSAFSEVVSPDFMDASLNVDDYASSNC